MNSYLKIIVGFSIVSAGLLIAGCGDKETENQESQQPGRTIEYTRDISFLNSRNDTLATIKAAVADEPDERNQGLMDVNSLPSDRGMIFIFEQEQNLSFWMANTPLSLDIIFVNEDLEIVRIHHSTKPFAETNFTSEKPAKYAVETNGGFCISHDIREGMRIQIGENPSKE